MKRILLIVAALCLAGCGKENAPNRMSIVSVGFRRGFTSDFVMQIGNLSAQQGVEARVHVFNASKTSESPRFVIPSGAKKDVGALEMGWNFAPGDRGYVAVESHPTRAYFAVFPEGKYGVIYSQAEYSDADLAKKDFSKALRTLK